MFKEKNRRETIDIVANIIIVFFAILNLFPIYWLFTSSLKNSADVLKMPPDWVPKAPTFANYVDVFKNQPALRWTFNSVFVAFVSTLLVIGVSSLAAYAFSKLRFKGKDMIFIIFISSLMIPKEIMIVPLFRITQNLNLVNKLNGMIWQTLLLHLVYLC